MFSYYGELRPTSGWDQLGVWGTPANFNGFRVLVLLLQWRHSPEANQTLHDVWLSTGLVHCIYTVYTSFCPLTEFRHMQNSLCLQVLRSAILAALLHGTWAVGISQTLQGMELRNFRRGRHLYSARWPLRRALAHILVLFYGRPM